MSDLNFFPEDIVAVAKEIKLLALDVDGVLTDGSIYIDANGNESKKFYVHDGYGIVSIREKFGIETVVISGRSSEALLYRLKELNITKYWLGQTDKLAAINICLLYTSPSPRDKRQSRMPSSA